MDQALVFFLVVVAVLTALPAWLTGTILKKHAQQAGEAPSDWIPFSLLPFAVRRFQHPNRALIAATYVVMNLVSWAALIALVVLYLSGK